MILTKEPTPETRLAALGVTLPAQAPSPIGAFQNVRIAGGMAYVSGQGPVRGDGSLCRGKVGGDVTPEDAREHARLVGINILAALRDHLGSLDRVASVVKLLGLVNATPDFERHPYVIDGASNLMAEIFGESGRHARSAIGVGSLPNNITVEIEAIFEIAPDRIAPDRPAP
ncbi:RidA family protein [Paracoccus pacificus]|uniref:RidA family protein n=1 Tax=Paracoccus pacificus TaxID=1463598 RepID=A0ABW4R2U2_9RHOB